LEGASDVGVSEARSDPLDDLVELARVELLLGKVDIFGATHLCAPRHDAPTIRSLAGSLPPWLPLPSLASLVLDEARLIGIAYTA
jgi:hypothetical protein